MPEMWGHPVSVYCLKVMLAAAYKGIDFDVKLATPMSLPEKYRETLHPLGKIPCWKDGDFVLPDSSAILMYLEKAYPEVALLPADAKEMGRVLWWEEFSDTHLASCQASMFYQRILAPLLGRETDPEAVRRIEAEAPKALGLLDAEIARTGGLGCESINLADMGVLAQIISAGIAGLPFDAQKFPQLARRMEEVRSHAGVKALLKYHGEVLQELQGQSSAPSS